MAAGRSQRNAPSFRRIWGFGGLYKRKAPKAPPNSTQLGGKRPPRWGGGPAGARGGPSDPFAVCGRLTAPRAWRIILIEALRQAVSPMIVLPNSKNRHRAGWRFLRFTMIVTVNAPICNVIRMASPPPWGCGQPPAALQRLDRGYHNPAKFTSVPKRGGFGIAFCGGRHLAEGTSQSPAATAPLKRGA